MNLGRFLEKWIDIYIENPFKTWWKVRKYFKLPNIRFYFFIGGDRSPIFTTSSWCGKMFDIKIKDLMWKDKYNSPRHEANPIIYFCLFKWIGFYITPIIKYQDEFGEEREGDMIYWEYVLDYLYYKKTLRSYSCWTGQSKLYRQREYGKAEDGSEDSFKPYNYVIPCVAMSLNKKGIAKLKKELENEKEGNITNN